MIRVLIADDQAVMRTGLRMILSAHDDIEVVGEAGDGDEAVRMTAALDPDVVLMDIRMPVLDGIEATRQVLAQGGTARTLVLTTYGLDEYVYAALRAGATGFLLKTDPPEKLVEAIRAVASGDAVLGVETTRRLIEHFLRRPQPTGGASPLQGLTDREAEVLLLVARGMSNAEIAAELYIGEGTVKTHVARVLAKLGLRDRVQAAVWAHERGLLAH